MYKDHKFHFATTKAAHVYSDVKYGMDDMLVFGKETAGIPESILKEHWDDCIRIPMACESRSPQFIKFCSCYSLRSYAPA